jgi:hypothetical protein
MAHRNRIASKNLDVRQTSHGQEIACTKAIQQELASAPHLSSLRTSAAQPDEQPEHRRQQRYRVGGTRYISVAQATNIIEAVQFAKLIALPLVAHLTIHWAYTNVGDDPDGKRFAKVREGLAKWLRRHGIVFAAVWCIERMSRGQAEVVHCHLLFHLPVEYRTGARLLQVEAAIYRLIKKHGRRDGDKHGHGYWAEEVIDLRTHENPDGKYLIKGGGPKVWKRFGLRKEHRRFQGIIHGKRCGTTENIGSTARRRTNKVAAA